MRKVVRRPERHDARPDGSLDRRRRYRRSNEIGQPPSGEEVLALSVRTVSPGFIAGGACASVSERSPSTLLLMSRELRCAITVQFPELICPTWQETYFAIAADSTLNLSGKSKVKFRPSCSARGASAVVTNVGAGCGGRGSVGRAMLSAGWVGPHERTRGTRRRALKRPRGKFRPAAHEPGRDASRGKLRTAKACGPGTRGWCQAGEDAFDPTGSAHRQFAGDGGKTNSSPRRARHKPLKPLRREGRVFRRTCGPSCASFAHDCGCRGHPAFPAPSALEGRRR